MYSVNYLPVFAFLGKLSIVRYLPVFKSMTGKSITILATLVLWKYFKISIDNLANMETDMIAVFIAYSPIVLQCFLHICFNSIYFGVILMYNCVFLLFWRTEIFLFFFKNKNDDERIVFSFLLLIPLLLLRLMAHFDLLD